MSTHSGNSRESSPEREEHQKTKDDETPRQDPPAKDLASGHLVPNVIVSSPNGGSSKKSSRDPSPADSVKSNTSEKAKTTDPKKRVTRSTANTIPADYLCRIRSQADRLASIKELADSMNSQEDPGMAMYEYWSKHIDQLFDEFKAEHNKLESSCPAALLDHEYFTQGTLCLAERGYQQISLKLAVLKEKLVLNGKFINKHDSCSSSAHPSSTRPKLPEIKLINFSGSYADWPAYKEMFTTMVADNNHLTNVEKLHYLRGSLSKEPLQLIQGLHLSGDSLAAAWDMLSKRYENKRYIIQSYLDMLSNTAPAQHRNAASLNTLTSSFAKARQALLTLTDKEKLADLMFVSQLVRLLDRQTKEAWETHIMNLTEECSFEQLYEFLVSRIRAIERVDGKESASTSTVTPSKHVKAHVGTVKPGSTSPTSSSQAQATFKQDNSYPCSHCQDPGHFIVMCPRFKNASTQERKNIVVSERLCYNCLGRHSARNCRSSVRCKVCGQLHHTMIHPEDEAEHDAN
ncbi:unnamed protein product [Trichogramma brassicae]|uniref:CCHC-type domain-containing protein n=1 Tax=Trichogramma brassicae TaxID=86971 RepID=A0A6H5J674_9HYME|nr:unnamed protein product [Trichogramma brassicae]